MEFPDTYRTVDKAAAWCEKEGIEFLRARSHLEPEESWRMFGPPARKVRWCCSVHKTAPVMNKLCEIMGRKQIRSMMITGVRGDESVARSDYDEISLGKKLAGQYSYHTILHWSSAEVYVSIYSSGLLFNELYKKGFNRVGCVMCPNSSEKHEYIKRAFYPAEVGKYCDMICETSKKDLSGDNRQLFIDIGGWKSRLSGRELKFEEDERYTFEETAGGFVFTIVDLNSDWITWYKTMGDLTAVPGGYVLEYKGVLRKCGVSTDGNKTVFAIENDVRTKNSIEEQEREKGDGY